VLAYEYDLIIDGADLPRPVNYMLMRIRAPEGAHTGCQAPVHDHRPRAGHGAGIGGFKSDSEVGRAQGRNPVYFVTFRPEPEPGQTIGDVTEAEAAFVAEILRRHPGSPKPVIVGNCQGWASLLLAATNPDLVGPLVMNRAPVAAWSGISAIRRCATTAALSAGRCPR
jgi:pimeloyl-ACP methyl ester carboxylesterase